jgi:hypothetical protein
VESEDKESSLLNPQSSLLILLHRGCGMWKEYLWRIPGKIFFQSACGKTVENSTMGCGMKTLAAQGKSGVIHITFP